MKPKIVRVMEENWDFLIILDACRYDYFSEIYSNFLNGKLEKRMSVGYDTPHWLKRSFQGYYPEIIYISGNPLINSLNVKIKGLKTEGFKAKDHFYKVIDVWKFGWNSRLDTVPPWEINKAAIKWFFKYPWKRFIIHYVQPHAPYISPKFQIKKKTVQRNILWPFSQSRIKTLETLMELFAPFFFKLTSKDIWNLYEIVGLSPKYMRMIKRIHGNSGLKEAYRENLRIVLRYVTQLCSKLLELKSSAKIIVTSDHGELLGEGGVYSHYEGLLTYIFPERRRVLSEIPWLIVEGIKLKSNLKQ